MNLLVLHAVRLKGFADTEAVAARFGLDLSETSEELLDAQAFGWVSWSEFAGLAGWSLTEAGRRRNEAMLREELDRLGARAEVERVHDDFLPLNAEAARVFTAVQLGSAGELPLLAGLAGELRGLEERLDKHLPRFAGYYDRFATALARAADQPEWITGVQVDSCHRVWFELHEDLVATLDIAR